MVVAQIIQLKILVSNVASSVFMLLHHEDIFQLFAFESPSCAYLINPENMMTTKKNLNVNICSITQSNKIWENQ